MTALVWGSALTLLVWGFVRKWREHGPDSVMLALVGFTVVSMVVGQYFPLPRLAPILAALDGAMVIVMAMVWTRWHSQRARFVGSLGLAKVGWALWAWSFPVIDWNAYAAALNGAFFAQALVAGGFCDGMGRWLADLHGRIHRGVGRIPGHVG